MCKGYYSINIQLIYLDGYCDFCKGKRYLDWIDEIFGVSENEGPKPYWSKSTQLHIKNNL